MRRQVLVHARYAPTSTRASQRGRPTDARRPRLVARVAFRADGTALRHRRRPRARRHRAHGGPRVRAGPRGGGACSAATATGRRRSWSGATRAPRASGSRTRSSPASARRAATSSSPASSPPRRSRSSRPTSGASSGVVISASHNPPEYNGIKFFAANGIKLSDELEDEIEAALARRRARPRSPAVGPCRSGDARERYLEHLVDAAEAPLDGMTRRRRLRERRGVRAGAGAAAAAGRRRARDQRRARRHEHQRRLRRAAPRGRGGRGRAAGRRRRRRRTTATPTARCSPTPRARSSTATRCWRRARSRCSDAGRLAGNTVVTTVMANLGFHHAMREAGIEVVASKVGDRYVLEEMLRTGAVLGGEQSGHVIFREHATTGDGLLTAVRFLSLAAQRGSTVRELARVMRRYPQVLMNVEVRRPGGAGRGRRGLGGRARRPRRAGRRGPRAGARLGHRAARARDGRGRDRGPSRDADTRSDRRGSVRVARRRLSRRRASGRSAGTSLLGSASMCGIVGYVGPDEALPIIIEGSAGSSTAGTTRRASPSLDGELARGEARRQARRARGGARGRRATRPGTVGMGHTRWATHGAPTDRNAHPHLDCTAASP